MRKSCWASLLVSIWLGIWCCSETLSAQKSHYAVDLFDSEKGLPEMAVVALTQTRDGYIWAGTLNGLARFDGLRFTTFDESNTPGLNSSQIIKLFEDSTGTLWIGTESAGIFQAREGRVTSVSLGAPPEGRLMSVCEDNSGAVWLYTSEGRLARIRNGRTDIWQVAQDAQSHSRPMIADTSGFVWVGTDTAMFGLQTTNTPESGDLPLGIKSPPLKLDYLLSSGPGLYWRLANGRIQKFNGTTLVRDFGSYPWSTTIPIAAACEDREGNLVVGTYGDGVYWFDSEGNFTHLSSELSHKTILSLIVDREGCLWVGTNGGGLDRVRRQVFDVLPGSDPFTVQSVCGDGTGGLWIGYNGERIDHWSDGELKTFTNLQSRANLAFPQLYLLRQLYVRSVFLDREHRLWAGVFNQGLLQFTNGQFGRPSGAERVPQNISVIFESRNGKLWLGTQEGLVNWDGAEWKPLANPLLAQPIRAIIEDKEGALWVGTEGAGIKVLQEGAVTSFTRNNGLPSDNIRSLLLDADGVIWAGTSSGLARFKNGRWTSYQGRLGNSRGGIGYLLDDDAGFLWMGSTAGLLRARKADLAALENLPGESVLIRAFGKSDGLPSGECSQGSQPAAFKSGDGRLWFPTISGLVSVDPALIKQNTNAPPVIIESVSIDGRPQHSNTLRAPFPQKLVIPAGRESLEIQYTSLNFSAPDKGLFKYILRGHENSWTERPAQIRSARYSRLPHGSYEFQVIACNEDGVWNKTGATLAITVLPPFWRTWWFISLSTVLLLGVIIGSASYVSTQKLQRQLAALRQKEALENERARIARDLHDQLGANLTQVALLGEMAEADKELPGEVESHAKQICQTARETTHALDEIVWTVNPSNDTLDGLINYVCKYAQDYLAMAGLKYRLEVPPQLPTTAISPELRHNVFLASKEAINNVVKHARATSAHVRLTLSPSSFVLEIEDNGQGLPASAQAKGRNGLRNMRKRMEEVGGEFDISSVPEGGTRVRLVAPLKGDHSL